MPKELQIVFKVEGLGAPEKGIVFGDSILMRGIPRTNASYVFFKVRIQNEEEIEQHSDDREKLNGGINY